MNGFVTGGWSFVWSAYLVTAVLLGGYVIKTIALWRDVAGGHGDG